MCGGLAWGLVWGYFGVSLGVSLRISLGISLGVSLGASLGFSFGLEVVKLNDLKIFSFRKNSRKLRFFLSYKTEGFPGCPSNFMLKKIKTEDKQNRNK